MVLRFEHPTYESWQEDLKAYPTHKDKIKFIYRSLRTKKNLHIFGRFFFPHIIQGNDPTPDVHLELIEFLTDPNDGACIFPRGFAKSTWEKIDTLHDIVYGLEPVILYISATLQDAGFHFEAIKSELENNEWLREVYGNLVPDTTIVGTKWTNTHFETLNGVNVVARGACKGRGVNIKNKRPTKIIIDDAESDEQVHSTWRRKKYHNWLYNVILPSRDKKRGRVKIIGTVIHPECEVLKFYKGHGGVFRRAIENGQSIWPAYWTTEDLTRLRDGYENDEGVFIEGIGTVAFSQEYMNEPLDTESVVFRQEWLDQNAYEQEDLPALKMLEIKMAVDPQSGESEMADFLGIVVIGRDKYTRRRYVLHAEKFKASIDKQVERVKEVYMKWKPLIMGVEKVLNQTALYQLLRAEGDLRLRPVQPEGKDKVNRARLIEPLVEQGVIKFQPAHIDLYNEMIQFPNAAHDDVLDAFMYANSLFAEKKVKSTKEAAEEVKQQRVNRAPTMITAGIHNKRF